ncbi:ATP-binding protein [Sphingomonas sp.]|uniref:ATP-binding protein n=1 Tax=Sphingomonas sp. TaxID=28214 RepID=UPI001EC5303B|nr:ATP-binding protein [Sphingomonas sp.]MBX3594332.1 response regulator [Sphingomonas sp.]
MNEGSSFGSLRRWPRPDWRAVLMLLIALLGVGVLIALIVNLRLADADRDAALKSQSHSYEVMILTQALAGTMADAEATLARYVVSGERNVGRDYTDKWQRAGGQIELLARRTRDNPEQQRFIAELRALFATRGRELDLAAHNTSFKRNQAAFAYFDEARRSPTLPALDRVLRRMFEGERTRLAQRSALAETTAANAAAETLNLILFGILIVLGAIVLGWLNVNAIRDRAAADADAAAQRERTSELEAAVATATAGLQAEARERAAAEAQLRQAQKMEAVGQLTGGIAHDFNNMLAVALGGIELARRHLPDGTETAARHLDNAAEGANRAAALTRRLLAFARSEALAPQAIDPVELIAGMSALFERTLGEGIQVATAIRAGGWHVWADRHQLENALLNLAVNARDAMEGRGTLTIVADHMALTGEPSSECAAGNYVSIAVADSGCGMAPEVLERVFEPFFTTKPVGKGTGLGLSQIFGFARQSGGEVRIESQPGEGTTVTLLLPCHAGGAEAEDEAAQAGPQPGVRHALDILLVEDDPRVLAATIAALEELGHRPVSCDDPLSAPRIVAGLPALDLIITDVIMPGQTGPEMVGALRPQLDGVAILYVTGYAGDASDHDRFGGHPVLRKPFTLSALEAAIDDAIGNGILRAQPDGTDAGA